MPNAQRYCRICSKHMRSDNLKRHMKRHNQSLQGDLSIPLEIVKEEPTASDNLKIYINQHNQNSPGDLSIHLEMVKEELRGLKGSLLTLEESLGRIENHIAGEDNFNTLKKHKIVYSRTSGEKNNIFTSVNSGDLAMSSQAMQSENSKENFSSNKLQEHEVKHSIIISGIEIPTDKDMSILEIENYAKNLNIDHFQGVYDIDRLPDKHKEEECGIVRLVRILVAGHVIIMTVEIAFSSILWDVRPHSSCRNILKEKGILKLRNLLFKGTLLFHYTC